MENLNRSSEPIKAVPQHSLVSEAWSAGSQLLDSADHKLHDAEKWVGEHKVVSAVGGAVAASALAIGMIATKGEMGKASEVVAEIVGSEGKVSGLASEATNLLNRSSSLRTVGAVTAVVPLALLTGCDKEPKEKVSVYKNAEDCAQGGIFAKDYCDSQYAAAAAVDAQTAPTFTDKKQCEDKTGDKCEEDPQNQPGTKSMSSHSSSVIIYRPWMYGYMVNQTPPSSDSSSYYTRSAPVYSSASTGELVTSHGDDLNTSRATNETEISRSALDNASRPISSESGEEAATESESGAFGRSSRAVTSSPESVSEGVEGEAHIGGVSRGGFGGGEGGGGVGGE
jgi:uncharacterized protein YgiB involved in biofilm formation